MTEALLSLADTCQAASGDFHTLHFAMRGSEFDSMHKEVLKEYYEHMADDADDIYEWCSLEEYPSLNEAAARIAYKSFAGPCDKAVAVARVSEVLKVVCDNINVLYHYCEKIGEEDPVACGLAAELQSKLSYWGKELKYFNARRKDVDVQ